MKNETKTQNPNIYFETEFYRHYRAVTQEEYKKAKEMARRIQLLKELRSELLAEKKIDPAFIFPSDLWQKTIDFFCGYCNDPSYELVNTWRLHTFPFKGKYPGEWMENGENPIPSQVIARYVHHTQGLPDNLIVRPPPIMAELGWWYNGGIVNPDMLGDQIRIQTLYWSGVVNYLKRKPVRILEIGGGYGAFAYALDKMLNPTSYTMCDLLESLQFASVYIGIAKSETETDSIYDGTKGIEQNGFSFVPNFLLENLVGKTEFDFIVNIGSLTEMTITQAEKYSELIEKLMTNEGIFFEANGQPITNPHPSIVAKRFKHIDLIRNERLWYKNDSVAASVSRLKPIDTRSKVKLVKEIVSALGTEKALRLVLGKEWIKLLLDRF